MRDLVRLIVWMVADLFRSRTALEVEIWMLRHPIDHFFEYNNEALVLHFTLPLKNPIRSKRFTLEVFDPTYFIDFELQEKDPIKWSAHPLDAQ
jgi:ABC-type uncharacterized transport system substrate-binding protein